VTIFYCLRFETSLFVASYDSQGHGRGIRTRLHTGVVINFFKTDGEPCRSHLFQQYFCVPCRYFTLNISLPCEQILVRLCKRFLGIDVTLYAMHCIPRRRYLTIDVKTEESRSNFRKMAQSSPLIRKKFPRYFCRVEYFERSKRQVSKWTVTYIILLCFSQFVLH
jgi:hypothetical protein